MTEFVTTFMPLAYVFAGVAVGVLAGLALRRIFGVTHGDRLC